MPYYREVLLEAGVVTEAALAAALASGERPPGAPPPAPAVDLSRFERVPLLDRDTLRARFDDLKSDDLAQRRWKENATGGSTGEPAHFIQDQTYREWVFVGKMLFDEWTGLRPADPQVRLWAAQSDVHADRQSLRMRAGRGLRNELWLDAFRMAPEAMRAYVAQINEFRPVQILGYAESLDALAALIEAEGLQVWSPRALMTSASVLEPSMRARIERVFAAPVFDRYGSREVADAACECERHAGLHVSTPTHVVEVLRPDGTAAEPGEMGELVVTLLTNEAMPLIRYSIGDVSAWAAGACPCGRSWPLLERIHGRVSGLFVTEEGGLIPGGFFGMAFYDEDLVAKYQVVQESVDDLRLKVVPAPGARRKLTGRWLAEVTAAYRKVIGPHLQVALEVVDDIPVTATGKHRSTISKVDRQPTRNEGRGRDQRAS